MFVVDKMLTLLLRINSPHIFTVYIIYALRKVSENFQENIIGGVLLVYDRYSEQSLYNLTKRRTVTPEFSGEMFKNGWLWCMAASEQCEIAACYLYTFITPDLTLI